MSLWKKGVAAALAFSLAFSFTPVHADEYEVYEDYGDYDSYEDYDGYGEYGGHDEYDGNHDVYEDGHDEYEGGQAGADGHDAYDGHEDGDEYSEETTHPVPHRTREYYEGLDEDGDGIPDVEIPEGVLLTPEEKAASDAQWEEDILDLPSSASLDLPEMWQVPELPTGCESVALTIALNYMGCGLKKETFAQKYLRHHVDDMTEGFVGDPFSDDGAGIFPPALVASCNDYFESQDSDLVAFETTSYHFGQLLALTAKGCPVVIWVTTEYDPPQKVEDTVDKDGIAYQWYANEHCVVIQGYDLDTGRIVLSDPGCGYIGQDLDDVRYLVESIGGYSLAISAIGAQTP